MTNPAVFIVTGAVMVFAAVIAIIVSSATEPQKTSHGRGGHSSTRYQPPSPLPSPPRRRRKSRERRSGSPIRQQHDRCQKCDESQCITVLPCSHSLCRSCLEDHVENNDTCPVCHVKINSCSASSSRLSSPLGKCINCRKFTKLFEFLPCHHSLSLCISCFEEQNKSYSKCPECNRQIQGSKPSWNTSGLCNVCHSFTKFAVFQPCGHVGFCRGHALQYLEGSGQECSECGERVTDVV